MHKLTLMELKYQRPTRYDLGHTRVIINGKDVGYFLPFKFTLKLQDQNYVLVLFGSHVDEFFSSRAKCVEYISHTFANTGG